MNQPDPRDGRPWALRRMIDVPETTRCDTCRRDDVAFLVLDNRDMKWRCAACASPDVPLPEDAPPATLRHRARRHAASAAAQ